MKVARETTPQLEHSSVPVKLFLKTGCGQDRAGGQFADSFPRRLQASHGLTTNPTFYQGLTSILNLREGSKQIGVREEVWQGDCKGGREGTSRQSNTGRELGHDW